MEHDRSIEAEEQLLKLHERGLADPESEEARIVRLAEVYAVRFSVSLASAISAVQRGER